MPDLVAAPPLGEIVAQVEAGQAVLTVIAHRPMHLLAPYPGDAAALSAACEDALGIALPEAGRCVMAGATSLRWAGREQILLVGPDAAPASLAAHGAVTDVSDVYVGLHLGGRNAAAEVLARLVPLDLRPGTWPPHSVARSLLGHIPAIFMATDTGVELLVMRSFAQTAHHEVTVAMRGVAARAALPG